MLYDRWLTGEKKIQAATGLNGKRLKSRNEFAAFYVMHNHKHHSSTTKRRLRINRIPFNLSLMAISHEFFFVQIKAQSHANEKSNAFRLNKDRERERYRQKKNYRFES